MGAEADLFALLAGQRAADPYAAYRAFAGPPTRVQLGWVVTRLDDVTTALRDPRFSADPHHLPEGLASVRAGVAGSMLAMDPPDHTRLRRLAAAAFTPRRVEALEPWIRAQADELIDAMLAGSGAVDLVTAFAQPLPVAVIAHLFGTAPAEHPLLADWGDILAGTLEPTSRFAPDPRVPETDAALDAMLGALIAERRRAPGDDLLSAFVAARDEGQQLTDAELRGLCGLVLVAGFVTTVNLVGNAAHALLAHPDQLAALRSDPSALPEAVEEALRFDAPIQATSRITTAEVELGGQQLGPHELVVLLLGAANRDPGAFVEPDRFELRRPDARHHVAFGGGVHHCLGAPLARLEARIALQALLDRAPGLRLDAVPSYRPTFTFRRLEALPVLLR